MSRNGRIGFVLAFGVILGLIWWLTLPQSFQNGMNRANIEEFLNGDPSFPISRRL